MKNIESNTIWSLLYENHCAWIHNIFWNLIQKLKKGIVILLSFQGFGLQKIVMNTLEKFLYSLFSHQPHVLCNNDVVSLGAIK